VTGERIGARQALTHALILARRNLLHIKADPEQISGMTIQPLMFLLLFVYVFGGAISGSSSDYLQFALPGQLVMLTSFTAFQTGLGLSADFQRGLVDRFRSLPIARSAVIMGRVLADGVRIVWGIVILTAFGIILGFRFQNGAPGALGALALATAFGMTLCWPMAFIGVSSKSPESVNTWGFLFIFPLIFASTVFVPADSMPGWLASFVKVNPISLVSEAARGLMLGGTVADPLTKSIIWMAGLTLVFGALAVRRYRRRT
jgi:oleandomycin transport system permease protein